MEDKQVADSRGEWAGTFRKEADGRDKAAKEVWNKIPCDKVLDPGAMKLCREHWNQIAKPLYGLGALEEYIVRIAGIQGTHKVRADKKGVVVMCADNGIVEEHISQSDSSVTAVVAKNIAEGRASINHMAHVAGADVIPVDIGMEADVSAGNMRVCKVARGTRNFRREEAMSGEQVGKAIQIGIDIVGELKANGYQMVSLGEMGIGNTTTSSALTGILLGLPANEVTGRGAGLSDQVLAHKIEVIQEAIDRYHDRSCDAFGALCAVGGLDLCGLAGVCIGGAVYRMPIVLDGFITAAAALAACYLHPEVRNVILPSHMGKEAGMAAIYKALHLQPVIYAALQLGEGTGGILLFPLLEMALSVYQENEGFHDLDLEPYQDYTGSAPPV